MARPGLSTFLHLSGAAIAFAVVAPMAWLLIRATGEGAAAGAAIVFHTDMLWAIGRSLLLAAVVAVSCVVISVPMAWLTHASDVPGRSFFRRVLVLPLAVPSYVAGFVVVATLGASGTLAKLGLPHPEVYGFFGAAVALMFTYPYVLLPLQAAIARVDPHTWEAARSLGSTPLQAFFATVWPEIRSAAARGGILVGLYVLGDFGAVSLARYPTLSYLIYQRYSSPFMRQEAVWYALVLVVLALAFVAASRLVTDARGKTTGHPRPWPVIELGAYRWPAFAYCALIVGLGAAVPIATVAWWLVRGIGAGNSLIDLRMETFNSLWMASAAAVAITLIAIVPSLLGRFGNARLARYVDRACHLGYALPGLVVGLALVYLGTRTLPWLYHTVWLLQLAYLIRFLPQASSTLSDDLQAQNPHIYEAARSLGASPSRAIIRVVLPLSMPALAAGALAVFISVIKELPATLLLKAPGFSTLAQRVWSLTEDAFFTAASPTVLVLLGLALGALWLRPDASLSNNAARSSKRV